MVVVLRRLILLGLVLLVTSTGMTAVADVPVLPHAFYGSVEIDGEPATAGTKVEARGTGVLSGVNGNPIEVTLAGQYGGSGGFDVKLVVQGSLTDGTELTFSVDGVKAQCSEPGGVWRETYVFEAGAVTQLDLRRSAAYTETVCIPLVLIN